MIRLPSTPYQLSDALRSRLIPWVEGGAALTLMDAPPRAMGTMKVQEIAGAPLRAQRGWGGAVREQFWLEENLNAMSVPYLGCVLEGEADIIVGATTAMCRRKKRLAGKRWIVSAVAGQFFLVPPGVPISAGGKVHWERPEPEKARSAIAWFQFHPAGVAYHSCRCEKGEHDGTGYLSLRDGRLLPVVENVIEEMQARDSQSLSLAYHYFGILFRYMLRNLENNRCGAIEGAMAATVLNQQAQQRPPILERALQFIEMHLNDPQLKVASIAMHAQTSPTHLNRIFRAELSTSVKHYVAEKRHQAACRMLLETSYNVRQISIYCGYNHVPSFIKSFSTRENIPPLRYRNRKPFEEQMVENANGCSEI